MSIHLSPYQLFRPSSINTSFGINHSAQIKAGIKALFSSPGNLQKFFDHLTSQIQADISNLYGQLSDLEAQAQELRQSDEKAANFKSPGNYYNPYLKFRGIFDDLFKSNAQKELEKLIRESSKRQVQKRFRLQLIQMNISGISSQIESLKTLSSIPKIGTIMTGVLGDDKDFPRFIDRVVENPGSYQQVCREWIRLKTGYSNANYFQGGLDSKLARARAAAIGTVFLTTAAAATTSALLSSAPLLNEISHLGINHAMYGLVLGVYGISEHSLKIKTVLDIIDTAVVGEKLITYLPKTLAYMAGVIGGPTGIALAGIGNAGLGGIAGAVVHLAAGSLLTYTTDYFHLNKELPPIVQVLKPLGIPFQAFHWFKEKIVSWVNSGKSYSNQPT